MRIVFFDFETTGLNPDLDTIIEVGAVKSENGKVLSSFSVVINQRIPIPKKITKITGITDEEILKNGREEREVMNEFFEFIGDDPLVGHNAIYFDIPFIEKYLGARIKNRVSDTLIISKFLLPGLRSHSLRRVASNFGIPWDKNHRALEDAIIAMNLWEKLKERAKTIEGDFIKNYIEKLYKNDFKILDAFYLFLEDL